MATINKDKLIEELIERFGDDILRICYLYTKDYSQAEDLFQEVFIKVYKNIDSFNNQCEVSTWVTRIAINTCKDYLKSAWIKRNILFWSVEEGEKNTNTENEVLNDIEKDYILSSVLNLPSKYREVIYFYYYKDLKTKEIAAVLKLKESVVRSRLMRAREILKKELKEGLAYEE
ncbi:MAG: sigma-70 family RNA polymerase sigma factor [Clostridiales bacterium]|nr:sigma-70 family RNA polymerase sigma factor [Clostridiales bacterium]